jgi:serine/threonine-protein kinase
MDFGIAERLGGRAPAAEGMVRGTPRYLAPEQILGKEFDTRADIFACGVLFYELFTGRLPFPDSRNPAAVIQATLDVDPPPPHEHRAGIPPALDEILLRCLRKDPRGRYRDARELLVAFEGLTP